MALTRRQREILDFITEFIASRRYSPSLEEIAEHFGLSSVATVHKHVSNLEKKGFIRRDWNRSRSIDLVAAEPAQAVGLAAPLTFPAAPSLQGASRVSERMPDEVDLPGAVEALHDDYEAGAGESAEVPGVVRLDMRGRVAAGLPIEAVTDHESVAVPEGMAGRGRSFVLEVRGDSMIDEQIANGDFVIVEERKSPINGEKVVAVIEGEATLKTFFREPDGSIRLQPANDAYEPIIVRGGDLQIRGVVIGLMRKYTG
jgi:repressor LexA